MATNDSKVPRTESSKSLEAHPEPAKIEEHYSDTIDNVPPVTADIESTPRYIQYGSAILLGLAFGIGCYVWYNGGVPSYRDNDDVSYARAEGYDYFNSPNDYAIYRNNGTLPAPFENNGQAYASTTIQLDDITITPGSNASAALAEMGVAPGTVVYLFGYDSADVPESADLTAIATQANKNGWSLDVKAYTDEHGRLAYNKRLSERRAQAIANYLVAHGMPKSKVTVHGMGPTHAFGSDAADRRAEVVAVK